MKPIEIATMPPLRAPVSTSPIVRTTFDADPDTCGQSAVLHMTLPAAASLPEHHHPSSRVALVPLNDQPGPIAAPFQHTVEDPAPLSRLFARVDISVNAALKSSIR